MSEKNNNILRNKDKVLYLAIAMFCLNLLTNNEYFLSNVVGFNFKIIIKCFTIILMIYLLKALIIPLVKEVKRGLRKETVLKIAEYIFIVVFFLFMIYDMKTIF